VALAVAFVAFAGPAAAAVLPFQGAIGDEAGCRFFLTGEAEAGMTVFTADTLTSPAGSCDFVRALPSAVGDGVLLVEAACDGLGQIHEGLDEVMIELQGDAGWFVFIEGTEVAGSLASCPGAVEALSPGVRI